MSKKTKRTKNEKIQEQSFVDETIAIDLVKKNLNHVSAQLWMNTFSDQGDVFEDYQVEQIISEFGSKVTRPSNYKVHRFTEEQITEIRNLRSTGSKLKEIAVKFECSTVLISNICRNKLYKTVQE